MRIPRNFPKWDKTVDGLEDACSWALELERSRLPVDLVVPRAGQLWETIRDCEVNFHARIDLPQVRQLNQTSFVSIGQSKAEHLEWVRYTMMRFGTAVLQSGERVRILHLPEPKPIEIRFVPVRYHELHESIIPEKVRNLAHYHGRYELTTKIARTISDFRKSSRHAYFNEDFKLVEDVV
jgi:hypothetical protein